MKAARKARGLTQTALGDLIGCDGFQISRWERGAHQPNDVSLCALAEALGIEYSDFFSFKELAA